MSARKQSGLALIEALMALAVMAFGLLALVGVQSNLRQNADIARQRSEAVRIAQEEIEKWRGFSSLHGAGAVVYGDLQSDAAGTGTTVASEYGLTAQFTMTRSVFPTANTTTPAFSVKTLTVDVTWVDRNNEAQRVRLSTALQGVAPEFSGTLAVLAEGTPTSPPGGRHPAIPWEAVRLDDGTHSAWRPPQGSEGTVVWQFSNVSGLIDSTCTLASGLALTSNNLAGNCTVARAQLLSGYVNFADSSALATATEAMAPTGEARSVQVWVRKTYPVDELVAPGSGCFTGGPNHSRSFVPYYCAVPVSSLTTDPPIWSGYSYIDETGNTGSLHGLSVCRYTRYRDDRLVNGNPSIQNIEHPRAYYRVGQALSNQNFLVVRRVNDPDSSGLNCPDGTPLPADMNTYPQPATAP